MKARATAGKAEWTSCFNGQVEFEEQYGAGQRHVRAPLNPPASC
jgi:hypothetical protein